MKQLLGWLAGGVAAAGVVGVAILATQDPRPEETAPAAVAAIPAQADAPAAADEAATETAPALPRLTDLRIEPDGMSVLAGSAEGGETVAILIDGRETLRATASADGQFATVLVLDPSRDVRVLTLRADPDGKPRDSADSVMIAPTAVEEVVAEAVDEVAADPVAADEVGADVAAVADAAEMAEAVEVEAPQTADAAVAQADAEPAEVASEAVAALDDAAVETPVLADALAESETVDAVVAASNAVAVADAVADDAAVEGAEGVAEPLATSGTADANEAEAEAEAEAAPETAAVAAVLVSDDTGVRLAQPAIDAGATPEVLSSVSLDMITYDATGQVVLSGRSKGAAVRVYLDNAATTDAPVNAAMWQAVLGDVAPGVYTIRVDEIDATGSVLSRIETPFLREAPEAVAAAMADEAQTTGVAMKTVQPGHTLWAIARERYGEGIHYVEVFAANRDRIRNPDLIYPGQVFVLPEGVAAE